MYWQLALLLQILLFSRGVHPREECPKTIVNSCSDCIRAGPFCMWCNQLNFTKKGELNAVRCDTEALLMEKGCDPSYIISPNSSHFLERDDPLFKGSPQKDPIQLRPQEVKLLLRPGKPHTLPFRFKRAEDYPVDLYYLMDLSYSMKDDLENVKNLGENLLETLGKITSRARIGFGAFVDKTVLPFTNINKKKLKKPCPEEEQYCLPAFGYRHVLSMTENKDVFKRTVSSLNISGNLDTPEGSLDAIMQAAVCEDKIGWGNSTRLLVLTTDAGFHMAGDGKLGSILFPNDCKCHMGTDMTYSKSDELDYPSVGQVARKLSENNIQTIFAVTEKVEDIYKNLTKIIPRSEVGPLSEDSKNVVELIEKAYRSLSSKVTVTHEDLPDHITATYTSNCSNETQPSTEGTCNNVGVDQEVEFNVTLMAKECFGTKSFYIVAPGFQERMKVTVTTQCECDCGNTLINHEYCNSHGNITCAICSCEGGYAGQKCECKLGDKAESELKMACQRDNGTECSGLGDCVCGECQCHTSEDGKTIYGTHCECDDRSCAVYQNKLCGGNGQCDCGTCKCNPDFEGSTCQCKKSTEACRMAKDRSVCSGRGKCECNRCQCQEGYKPPFCEECPGCSSPCPNLTSCIECLRFATGVYSKNCTESCPHIEYYQTATEEAPKGGSLESSGWSCKERDTNNCWMTFTIKQLDGFNKYKAWIRSERECPEPPAIGPIIGGVFAGVALIGIILLLIIIGIIRAQERREWKNFEQSRKAEEWRPNNEIFKTATTTVKNPLHEGD
ncbi:integrin beta-2-like [Anguilla rostrata]|uniref:integrin beta-2-like n=1 Tax=Anguilla rostrata TaxID=7938 RepID=UPI0030D49790